MGKNFKTIIIVGLILVVGALTVAYATLSQTLNITGTAEVTGNTWSVEFQPSSCSKTGSASYSAPTVSSTSVTLNGITLSLPGDSVTCTVPIKNTGTVNAKLTAFTKKDITFSGTASSVVKDNVTYSVTYDGSANPTLNSSLNANVTKNVVISITFNNSATAVPSSAVTINNLGATLAFAQA